MRYFASYTEIFNNNDSTKREIIRLQAYNLAISFLTRKQVKGNYIVDEINELKKYFESDEFCKIYFLSPYILKEANLVKDIMNLVVSSGESNTFHKLFTTIKKEVKTISESSNFTFKKYIKVETADEYLQVYLSSKQHYEEVIDLEDKQEIKILNKNLEDGLAQNNEELSILYIKLKSKEVKSTLDLEKLIQIGLNLSKKFPTNPEIDYVLSYLYSNIYYTKKDKFTQIFNYLLKASNYNYSPALFMVGFLYFTGQGIQKNEEEALKYWSKAASLNNLDAISGLGIYYLSHGDKLKAKQYLQKSANSGDYKAILLLDTDFDRK